MSKRVVIPKNLDKYPDFPDGPEISSKKEFEFLVLKYKKEKKLEKQEQKEVLIQRQKFKKGSTLRSFNGQT